MIHSLSIQKSLGAFYTDESVANFITAWAVRPNSAVLDPSCGDGVFLQAAAKLADPLRCGSVTGVEISEVQARATRRALRGVPAVRVLCGDFFDYNPVARYDAIIGNPPFIRYQTFSGLSRERALSRCADAGVRLSRLASSWAPFLIVASQMLSPGGRLGFVLPAELLHAGYARPVLRYLKGAFEDVRIITFRERLFPELAQDTLILLASGKGKECSSLVHLDAPSIQVAPSLDLGAGKRIDPATYLTGAKRIKESFVDEAAMAVLERLLANGAAFRLGSAVRADIGYVTGANEFFHLGESQARLSRIPRRHLSPAVFRGRALRGLAYRVEDWQSGTESGDSGYLFHVGIADQLSTTSGRYIADGRQRGFASRHKCRVRTPWYCVPHVYRPHGFLTSMSGGRPRIAVNEANVLASNSLHILRVAEGTDLRGVAASWLSSITSLSIEIEGHALGGGMFKLEPTEAERVVIVDVADAFSVKAFQRLDTMMRQGNVRQANEFVDAVIEEVTGIEHRDLLRVRKAADDLRARRRKPRL